MAMILHDKAARQKGSRGRRVAAVAPAFRDA